MEPKKSACPDAPPQLLLLALFLGRDKGTILHKAVHKERTKAPRRVCWFGKYSQDLQQTAEGGGGGGATHAEAIHSIEAIFRW